MNWPKEDQTKQRIDPGRTMDSLAINSLVFQIKKYLSSSPDVRAWVRACVRLCVHVYVCVYMYTRVRPCVHALCTLTLSTGLLFVRHLIDASHKGDIYN